MKANVNSKVFKKLIWSGLILFAFGGVYAKSSAQATLKIGTVDVRKVYDNWSEKTAADSIFEPDRKKLEADQDAITTAQANLEKKKNVLSPEKIKEEKQKIDSMLKEFDKNYREVGKKISEKADELSKKLDDLLQAAYKNMAEKDGYTIILDSRFVRYSSPGMDLTDKITVYVNNASKSTKRQ